MASHIQALCTWRNFGTSDEIKALAKYNLLQMQRTGILCSQKILCWNGTRIAELVCALRSSSQCQIAAKKVERLPCLCILPLPLTPASAEAVPKGQDAVQHPLISNPLKRNPLIKREAEAGSWCSAASTGGAEPVGSAEVGELLAGGTESPKEDDCHNVEIGAAYLQYVISLDCGESETQTLLHLTQNAACKMPLQAPFPWKWTLALASLGRVNLLVWVQ